MDNSNTWATKRKAIYNLKNNIDNLKRKVRIDLSSTNEKDKLTALVVRIMIYTCERVGNEDSASNGHFGVTQFQPKHITIQGNTVLLSYKGKSGVLHNKSFSDSTCAAIIKELLKRNNVYLFTTKDGFRIKPDKVNRYLSKYNAKSKDIRGYNANRMVIQELNRIGKTEQNKRPRVFNDCLRKIATKVGHLPSTLRTHYLLPEIEMNFYNCGSVGRINLD